MYQINYFGNSEVSEFDKRKDIFKHGSKVSPWKVNVE